MKRQNLKWMLKLILIQSLLAIIISSAYLSFDKLDTLPSGTYIDNLNVGGLIKSEVISVADKYYGEKQKNKSIEIQYGDNYYTVYLDQMEVNCDYQELIQRLFDNNRANKYKELISSYTEPGKAEKDVYHPNYVLNEAKIKEFFKELSIKTEIEPKNPKPIIPDNQDESIYVIPAVEGTRIDVDKATQLFINNLETYIDKKSISDFNNNEDILTHDIPAITNDMIKGLDKTVARASIMLDNKTLPNKIKYLEELTIMNEAYIIKPGEKFSLRDRILDKDRMKDVRYQEEATFLATAIYQTIFHIKDIHVTYRESAKNPLTWIHPGGEAIISSKGDFAFINNSPYKIWLIPAINQANDIGKGIGCFILASEEVKSYPIKFQIDSYLPAPVIYKENMQLEKGHTRTIVKGKSGYIVSVYREESNGQVLLYKDRYEPINSIIEVGTGTTKEEIVNK